MNATYDAENHLIGEAIVGGPASNYQWGPNGQPIEIGSQTTGSFSYDTLHWDGDQVLFTTNAQGQVDDIKVGTIGDITPLDSHFAGLTLWDRDVSGEVVACHNATGAAGNGIAAPWRYRYAGPAGYTSPCSMQGANAPGWSIPWTEYPTSPIWTQLPGNAVTANVSMVGRGGVLGMPRTDGITDGFTTIQGVRSYDGFASAWMEPDAYSGVTGDPASQQAYSYNEGNPVQYGDRNGYDAGSQIDDPEPCQLKVDSTSGQAWLECWPPGGCDGGHNCVTYQDLFGDLSSDHCDPMGAMACGLALGHVGGGLGRLALCAQGRCLEYSAPSSTPCTSSNLAKLVTADETKKDVGGTIGGAIGGTSGGIIGNTVGGPVVGYIVGALTGISGTQALETIGQNYELCGGAATVPAFP